MIGGIKNQVTIFERDAVELKMGDVAVGFRGMKVFEAFVYVKCRCVIIREAIFEFVPEFPTVKILLADGAVATGAERDPLLVFPEALWHRFGLISVGEESLGC